jgi:hypothetical protein
MYRGQRKGLCIAEYWKTYSQRESVDTPITSGLLFRTIAIGELKGRCSPGQRAQTWEFRIAEERQET